MRMGSNRRRWKAFALTAISMVVFASGLPDSRTFALSGVVDIPGIDITGPVTPIKTIPDVVTPIVQTHPLRWKLILGNYVGTPAIAKDGTIYAAVHNGTSTSSDTDYIAAVTPYGTLKWSWKAPQSNDPGPLSGITPAIGPDGTIYVRTKHQLYAIDANGRTKWSFQEDLPSATAFGADGTVYVGNNSSIIYALSPGGGQVKWKYVGNSLYSVVAGTNGDLYGMELHAAGGGRSVLALSSSGTKKWSYSLGTNDLGSLRLAPDGSVLAFTYNKLFSIKPSGALKWEFNAAAPYDNFAQSTDGGMYLKGWVSETAPHSRVFAVSADGKKKWEWSVDASDPVVYGSASTDLNLKLGSGADGSLYATEYNYLYAVSSAGKKLWKYKEPEKRSLETPVASPDGTVIVVGGSDFGAAVQNSALLAIGTVPAEGVMLQQPSLSLETGKSAALKATVTPAAAVEKSVRWQSSNPAVAEVNAGGQVTGRSPGTAVITVTTVEGEYTASCTVTITAGSTTPGTTTPGTTAPGTTTPGTTTPGTTTPATPFTDIAGNWASADIAKAYESGITKGYTDGTFKPNASITRSEFTVMLMKGLKVSGDNTPLTFKDAGKIEAWAAPSVAAAVKLGIISGYSDGTFKPQANITHAEMIAMVVKASGLPTTADAATSYADDALVPAWAREAIAVAGKYSLLGGLQDNRFQPSAKATRAEAAAAIVRMLAIP
ncbi:PQQ-binding-like beta-propeller repeat protein [Paenibacillus rhizovicinus]|uniref:PQQ-binding-like beta-propeller repeat protein n=1 Tax=Paenibacillus rhizovicinus TaxID=2704463 RepID=A0A6C0P554_9BACL|nr:S-layer homology domain-containing protein [Paenibacillus rhizovicinus]QHW31782.1 PQQ-binding-like beta-propeller repeat protein [Paenibacillus rhizovicinus]